jgi:hypothetical protein
MLLNFQVKKNSKINNFNEKHSIFVYLSDLNMLIFTNFFIKFMLYPGASFQSKIIKFYFF